MFRHQISAPWPSQFLYSGTQHEYVLCLEEVINENLQTLAGFMLHIHLTRGESDCTSNPAILQNLKGLHILFGGLAIYNKFYSYQLVWRDKIIFTPVNFAE